MKRRSRESPEVRERAARMVFDHVHEHVSRWAAIASIARKFGCPAETLRRWVRGTEVDTGRRERKPSLMSGADPWSPGMCLPRGRAIATLAGAASPPSNPIPAA